MRKKTRWGLVLTAAVLFGALGFQLAAFIGYRYAADFRMADSPISAAALTLAGFAVIALVAGHLVEARRRR